MGDLATGDGHRASASPQEICQERFIKIAREQLNKKARAEAALTQAQAQKSALMEAVESTIKNITLLAQESQKLFAYEVRAAMEEEMELLARVYEQVKKDTALPSQPATPQP